MVSFFFIIFHEFLSSEHISKRSDILAHQHIYHKADFQLHRILTLIPRGGSRGGWQAPLFWNAKMIRKSLGLFFVFISIRNRKNGWIQRYTKIGPHPFQKFWSTNDTTKPQNNAFFWKDECHYLENCTFLESREVIYYALTSVWNSQM